MGTQRTHISRKKDTHQRHSAKQVAEAEKQPESTYGHPLRALRLENPPPPETPPALQHALFLQRSFGNHALDQFIQAKLRIGQPGDRYEQEADRVADEVMRIPEPRIQRKPT